jgi:hypothetical protein
MAAPSFAPYLFLPARLHAYLVLGLAGRPGIIFHAGLLLVATSFAAVLSPRRIAGSTKSSQHQQHCGKNLHDGDSLSMLKRENVSSA